MKDDGYRAWLRPPTCLNENPYFHARVWVRRDNDPAPPQLIDPATLHPLTNVSGLLWKPAGAADLSTTFH